MKIYDNYRKLIGKYMRWAKSNIELKKFTLIDAEDHINPNFIGTICSMLIKSENINTIVGLANDGDMIKISARSTKFDMNSNTAGATIQIEKIFILMNKIKFWSSEQNSLNTFLFRI